MPAAAAVGSQGREALSEGGGVAAASAGAPGQGLSRVPGKAVACSFVLPRSSLAETQNQVRGKS